MNRIVISGYYGFKNAGDEAMLAAMIEVLSDIDPAIEITVISASPGDTKQRHGVKAVYWLNYAAIARSLRVADLLISGGGSLLQNVTSGRSLYYYMSILMLAKGLGTPVMLYAQGIGPICGAVAERMMRWIGDRADLITVRDEGSLGELARLGIRKPVAHVTADPVLAIHPVGKQAGRAIFRRHALEGAKPMIGISVREWRGWTHYKAVVAETADRIAEELGARIVFLPMQFPEDVAAAEKIAARMRQKATVLQEEYTTAELLSMVGNLDLLLAVRLHALIFAGVMGVPMIGMSYDPKVDRFLTSIGETSVGDLQQITTEALLERVRSKWRERALFSDAKRERLARLRDAAFYNAELAMQLIGAKKSAR